MGVAGPRAHIWPAETLIMIPSYVGLLVQGRLIAPSAKEQSQGISLEVVCRPQPLGGAGRARRGKLVDGV